MSYLFNTPIGAPNAGYLDYNIGDTIINDAGNTLGVCTGFRHNDTCVDIDGKCYGGKYYFHKADTIDIEHEEL